MKLSDFQTSGLEFSVPKKKSKLRYLNNIRQNREEKNERFHKNVPFILTKASSSYLPKNRSSKIKKTCEILILDDGVEK
mgnify:CR=1 FL=1